MWCSQAAKCFKMAAFGAGRLHGMGNTTQEQDKGFECSVCKMRFSFKTNLHRHKRTIHKGETVRERTSCIFPGCSARFYHQTKLLSHLELAHGKNTAKTELTFSSMDEFLLWKVQEEVENVVCFTKQRGDIDHLSVTHHHYICQRDGSSRSHTSKKQPGRMTNRKLRKGVIKTDLVCPARMLVKQCKKSGRVNVSYYKTHSHTVSPDDASHHPLPKSVRKDIKNKLESGVSVSQIYQEFQNQSNSLLPPPTIHNNRLKYVNKAQIRAIQRRLHKNTNENVQSQSETALNVVVEVLQMADTCNPRIGRERTDIDADLEAQIPEQQNIQLPVPVNTDSSNITQELLFSEPVTNPLCRTIVPLDYRTKLQGMLNEILVLMENETVRKTMLPCVMGNLENMLSLCHQEVNSLNVRNDVEVLPLGKQS